jgi:hypothetical protein
MASYDQEQNFVKAALELAQLTPDRMADPKIEFGEEIGVDVLCLFAEKIIGVQVTEYNPYDDPKAKEHRSSRGEEKSIAKKNPLGYGFVVPGKYINALTAAIRKKLTKTFSRVDEGWLLIVAQIQNHGSTASTFLDPDHIEVGCMNEKLHPLLIGRHFSKAFLLMDLEKVLFEWCPETKWRKIRKDPRALELMG